MYATKMPQLKVKPSIMVSFKLFIKDKLPSANSLKALANKVTETE